MQTQSKELNFQGQNIYIGIDTHKKSWNVSIMTEVLTHKTFTQDPKPEILYAYLQKKFPGATYYSAYEAGFCGFWIHHRLTSLGVKSIVVNPADIPTTNKEILQKEDARDSRKIARGLINGTLTPIHILPMKTMEDRSLVRTRSSLVRDMTRTKNRIKSFLSFYGIEFPDQFSKSHTHWSKRFNLWLETISGVENSGKDSLNALLDESKNLRASILDITKKIKALSKSDTYKENETLLRTVPGIGLLTAMTILVELDDIKRFRNNDKLASYVGLIPSTFSSGEKEKIGDITPRCNRTLRNALIESAWIASRIDPALMRSYMEYCKTMEPNNAIIRIARKLLSRIRFVLMNKKAYELSKVE
jgi:transposase